MIYLWSLEAFFDNLTQYWNNRSLTILNDEDEDEDHDKFNGNEFLSIGSEYFSTNKRLSSASNDNNEDASEPYDLRYHHTFASLPVDQSHFSTSSRNSKVCINWKILQFSKAIFIVFINKFS